MFLFLLVDFKFENWSLKNRERPQGHEIVKSGVELVICKRGQSMIIFIGFLIKKTKGKFNGMLDPKVYLEKI